MDSKEKDLLDSCYSLVSQRNFDEKDIYLFLILLRRHGKRKSIIVEFADFVAHREKDRGAIHEYLIGIKNKLDQFGKTSFTLEIKPVYSINEIEKSINETLNNLGYKSLSNNIINEIILCLFILLQDVQFITNKKENFGFLEVGIDQENVTLFGNSRFVVENNPTLFIANFPVLILDNTFIETDEAESMTFDYLLTIKRSKDKKISLDLDLERKLSKKYLKKYK